MGEINVRGPIADDLGPQCGRTIDLGMIWLFGIWLVCCAGIALGFAPFVLSGLHVAPTAQATVVAANPVNRADTDECARTITTVSFDDRTGTISRCTFAFHPTVGDEVAVAYVPGWDRVHPVGGVTDSVVAAGLAVLTVGAAAAIVSPAARYRYWRRMSRAALDGPAAVGAVYTVKRTSIRPPVRGAGVLYRATILVSAGNDPPREVKFRLLPRSDTAGFSPGAAVTIVASRRTRFRKRAASPYLITEPSTGLQTAATGPALPDSFGSDR